MYQIYDRRTLETTKRSISASKRRNEPFYRASVTRPYIDRYHPPPPLQMWLTKFHTVVDGNSVLSRVHDRVSSIKSAAERYRRRGDLPWRGDVIIPTRKPAIIAGRNLKVSPLVRVVTPHANPPTRQPRFTRPPALYFLPRRQSYSSTPASPPEQRGKAC